MDIANAIRSVIFLVPGLALIFFPERVYRFQCFLVGMLHIKYNIKRDVKCYPYIGAAFIIISIILFVFAITH